MEKMRIKVMLVDDHPLFMEGLQYVLKTHGIEVIGTAKDGREAIEKAWMLKPDIILMDIRMPECSGLDVLRLIKAEMPEIKVVMLTISEEDEDLFNSIKYGASGYLLKNTGAEELINMLSDIENGEAPPLPGLAPRLLKEFRCESTFNHSSSSEEQEDTKELKLSERQLDILKLTARGRTYSEVGDALGLSERTVKYHMGRIIELLHLDNRAQVIAYAARMGIVKSEETKTE
jgi:two-component system NarL family response regulator